ncbi:MAG: DUF1015 domain-containing protein [Syntrophobacteraceae bacterium]|nr:DUF1015 domain-containing protein [Syntrophobacteraceae bacterium]
MAAIAPFRGFCYNLEEVHDLARVTIPPYDVISSDEQRAFHDGNPYNFIRLELGLTTPEDSAQNNPHTRAAAWIKQWTQQGILVRSPQPSIYRYELDYKTESEPVKTRRGFICALRLEDFSSGRVRPHEKTFQAAKDERLGLMVACNANLSPVFALYPDSGEQVYGALSGEAPVAPPVSFTDKTGMAHRFWPVTERLILDRVRELMGDKPIFIADGHHRYETALNYRNQLRKRYGGGNANASYEFIMVYLTDMNEPGLTILPTHRLLGNLGDRDCEQVMEKAKDLFHVERFQVQSGDRAVEWKKAIGAGGLRKEITLGVYCRKAACAYVLTAKKEEVSSLLARKDIAPALRTLDVVVLDQVLLREIFGLSEQFLADERNISFMHDFSGAVEAAMSDRFDAGFFINQTRIEQVREVADAGLIMPHKSTYFYPKVTSGLVINPLYPNEEIV